MHFDQLQKNPLPENPSSAALSQQPVCVKAILVLLKVVRSDIGILPILDRVVHLKLVVNIL